MNRILNFVSIFLIVTIISVSVILFAYTGYEYALSDSKSSSTFNDEIFVSEFHNNINDERLKYSNGNLDTLYHDLDIAVASEYKSNRMMEESYIGHVSPDGETVSDRFVMFGLDESCSEFGENIAQTHYKTDVETNYTEEIQKYQSESELAEGVVRQLMNSQDHRDSILSSEWDVHGVGISITDEGEVFVTQKFCSM